MQEAILGLHENPSISAESFAVTGGPKEILARTWSELEGLQADAESLDAEVDSTQADVDFPEDLIGSAWTNAEYARGQRLLRENRDHLPLPDLSFLGPLQPSVSKLSKAATRLVKTTAVLVQVALGGEPLAELDYGPQIASMAKACERILDDVLTSGDLTNVAKMVKKSIDANAAIKWNGMGNKRIALLLFGGWIPVYQTTAEHVLNPLEVRSSEEYVQTLPDRLSEFQNLRNQFVHHDLADTDDLRHTWECFQDCLKGLLQAFYSGRA
jgi:hypothetical protein